MSNFQYECRHVCAQSRPTLCDPKDCSLPGSSVHGIFQARNGWPFPTPFSVSKSHLVYMLDYYLLFIKFNYILAGNPRPQASNLTPLCSNYFTQSLRIMESSTRKHCLEN